MQVARYAQAPHKYSRQHYTVGLICFNVFRLFRRAEQTTTRYAGVQQKLYKKFSNLIQ